jgi:serine/threonine-protein kinase
MELVRGRSLFELLAEQHQVETPRAADIMRQILSGLAHAHEQGIVHRDIKPANIMITPKAPLGVHVRILDFGLARLRESNSSLTDGIAVGTPSYMAPEQCRGDPLDARVDIYACGVVLFEMLSGRKPFVASDPIAIIKMQLEDAPPRLGDVASGEFGELEAVVARALAKSPDDRFGSAVAMSEAIDAAIGGRIAPEATAAFADLDAEVLSSSALVPIDRSIEIPISTEMQPSPSDAPTGLVPDPHEASLLRRMLPTSRMRYVVLAAIVIGAAALAGIIFVTHDSSDAVEPVIATTAPAPSIIADAAVDPLAETLATANDLAATGRLDAALDVITRARRTNPDSAELAFVAGKLYFAKLWWTDGVKNLREAIRLDARYRNDVELIKVAIRGFITTPSYDERLGGLVVELGSGAAPLLDETARTYPNPQIRARASAMLRRLR